MNSSVIQSILMPGVPFCRYKPTTFRFVVVALVATKFVANIFVLVEFVDVVFPKTPSNL